MGFSVQLFETLAWAEELLEAATAADVRASPVSTPARVMPVSQAGPTRRDERPPSLRARGDPRYDPCEPGYSMFIEALGQVYCGDLDRYIELTGEVARALRPRARAMASPPTSTDSSRPGAPRRRWR